MGALLFNILFAGIAAFLGAAFGWWIRGEAWAKAAARQEIPEPPVETTNIDTVEEMMSRLHQLTASVAEDVGQHNSRVQEINTELSTAGDGEGQVLAIVEKLVQANEQMQSQLQAAEDRLQQQAREIESHVHEARTDALTKLFNRRAFDDEMKKLEEQLAASGRPSCVMMMDVDHFKKFNDTYGHQAGDEVLRGVARVLRKNLAGKEVVCRYGGEEFAVVFPNADVDAAMPAAERARAAIADEVFEFEGLDLKVTASAGLAQLQDGERADDLVKRADEALYVCKEAGRNCGHWHDGISSHPMQLSGHAPRNESRDVAAEVTDAFELAADDPEDRRESIAGLSSYKDFRADVDRRLSEFRRGGATVSVLLAEVDRFEQIVAEFGDKAGRVVLRATAQFLKATMRDMDHITRLGQRTFAVMLPGAGITETGSVAERLRAAVEKCRLPINGEQLAFTISLGGAEVAGANDHEELIRRAEESLEAAQQSGGNCCFATTDEGQCRAVSLVS